MKTRSFDGLIFSEKAGSSWPTESFVIIGPTKAAVSVTLYENLPKNHAGPLYANIALRQPFELWWGDEFRIRGSIQEPAAGLVKVLYPHSLRSKKMKAEAKLTFLKALAAGEKEMLAALCRENGIQGLQEKEIQQTCRLNSHRLLSLSQELEEEGCIKILAFSPLFLLFRESLEFFEEKLMSFLAQFHRNHPGERGIPLEKIRKRFDVPPRVLTLTLKALIRKGEVREAGNLVLLSTHEMTISPEEQRILGLLEEMHAQGEFRLLSSAEIQRRFSLTPKRLEKLLSILVERKKILQGEEGLFLHAGWLEEVIHRIRNLGVKELTVAEFKEMTGLSRKYAIPLLELLDQMRVTRRKGPVREILRP